MEKELPPSHPSLFQEQKVLLPPYCFFQEVHFPKINQAKKAIADDQALWTRLALAFVEGDKLTKQNEETIRALNGD